MRRLQAALPLAPLLFALAASAAAAPPLAGVWEIEEIRTVGPDFDVTNPDPQPGLYIFTAGFYSMVWSPGRELRKDSARIWEPTDAEKIRDFNTIVVNSGAYEIVDSTLIVRPLTAKTPEYVGGHATYTYRVEGDKLRLTLLDTFSHNGIEDQGVARYRTTLWLRRIE